MAINGTPATFMEVHAAADIFFKLIEIYTSTDCNLPQMQIWPNQLFYLNLSVCTRIIVQDPTRPIPWQTYHRKINMGVIGLFLDNEHIEALCSIEQESISSDAEAGTEHHKDVQVVCGSQSS